MQLRGAFLYLIGITLMSATGAFTERFRLLSIAAFVIGTAIFFVETIRRGPRRSSSAVWLLVASNVAFWTSVILWTLRRTVAPTPHAGIDTFAGTLALWLVVLFVFLIYEIGILLRNILCGGKKQLSAIGIVASLLQLPTSFWFAWHLVQGV
jgi:hypothetical protein